MQKSREIRCVAVVKQRKVAYLFTKEKLYAYYEVYHKNKENLSGVLL